jgi:rhodanese-related sulfurtransferase
VPDRGRVHRRLAVAAGVLGLLALVAGEPHPAGTSDARAWQPAYVTPIALARAIRDRKGALRLLDLRPDREFVEFHIPTAERVDLADLAGRRWDGGERVVVYAGEEARALRAARLLRAQGVDSAYVLRGGVPAWVDDIAQPYLAPLTGSSTREEQAARREQLALSRYFGGTPVVSPVVSPPAPPEPRRSEAAAVARVLRRGC